MKNVLKKFAILFLLTLSNSSYAAVEGRYKCKGYDPYEVKEYQADLIIEKIENNYKMSWEIINDNYIGSGLLENNSFAAYFSNSGFPKRYGIILYTIDNNGTLNGKWTYQTPGLIGTEICTKNN